MKKKKISPSLVKWLGLGAGLLLVPSLVLNIFLLRERTASGLKVVKVIDGDTFEVEGRQRVRLRHADAPEMGLCGSEEAKDLLAGLIEGKRVVLEEEVIGQQNRPLALVYQGEVLVNLEMVKSGWARYHTDSSSRAEELKQAGSQARAESLGVYGPECYQTKNPDQPECNIKGNIDKNKYEDNRKYYYPGCPQYNFTIVEKDLGEAWFCSEAEAQAAGFVKAKNCP